MRYTAMSLALVVAGFSGQMMAAEGQSIYEKSCKMCHGTGAAGAPKVGDKAAWKDRIGKGENALVDSAINGVQGYGGMMPPRGGNPNLTDAQIRAAVQFMMAQSK